MKMNPLELLKFVQGQTRNESEQLQMLATLAEPPAEDYQPKVRLPVQNEIPAYKVGDGSMGAVLANLEHGVAGPVIGQQDNAGDSIGNLIVGEL